MKIVFGTSQEQIDSHLTMSLFEKKVNIIYDYDKNDEEILAKINQSSLFEEEERDEIILITNASFLTSKTKKAIEFIKQLEVSEKDIICTVVIKDESSFNAEAKKIEHEKALPFNEQRKEQFIAKLITDNNVHFDCETTKQTFIQKVKADPNMIINEISKLQAYSSNGSEINSEIVKDLMYEAVDENVFNLLIKILAKDKNDAIIMFDQLIQRKYTVQNIIAVIANQLFDLKIQKQIVLKYAHAKLWDISKKFDIPYFILKKNETLLNDISLNKINKMLNDLLIIDYNIKTMQLIPITAFKLFILKDN